MNKTSAFFIIDEDEAPDETSSPSYTRQLFKMPEIPLVRLKNPSKFTRKWSDYVDETAIQKSVDPTNGDIKMSLPIVKINLTPLLKINIDLNYVANKDGVHFSIPLTRNFISVDYHKSIFKNDATFLMNSIGSKMQLERIGPNKLKMVEDVKGEVDVTYYPDREYFMVESDIEKIYYGSYGNTGTTLYEISYQNWSGTGNGVQDLKKIPVAWFIAERHSKVDGRSIYYHYENIEEHHKLNPWVSYTSEVMLRKISDGNETKIEFEYGLKSSLENKELKLKDDEGNLRMGNFLVEKHFLTGIKVETENYEQEFGITYDLFDGKLRILKSITQILDNGVNNLLKFKNKKLFDLYLPSEIEIYHGPTTKLTYKNQLIPMPQLEKKFLLKNRPVVSYGTNDLLFSSIIDNRIILKIFDIKTFKLTKEFSIFDQKTITEGSLQSNLGNDFLTVTYRTEDFNHIKIYYQDDEKKWQDTPTALTFRKTSKIYSTSHDFIVIHDEYNIVVLQKAWNERQWLRYNFGYTHSEMKFIIKGKSIFILDNSNLTVILKSDDQKWNWKHLKTGHYYNANSFANAFNANDEVKNFIRNSLENSEIKVMNNVVVLSKLEIMGNGLIRTNFEFITFDEKYDIKKTEQFVEDHENINDITKTYDTEGTSVTIKYMLINNKYELRVVNMYGKIDDELKKQVGRNRNKQADAKAKLIKGYNENSEYKASMQSQFLLDWKKYYPLMESGSNDLFFGENTQFRMTGDKWTRFYSERKRDLKLGEYFTLIFDKDTPEIVKLVSQKDDSVEIDIRLYQSNKLLNLYPNYIAYQSDKAITNLIIFDDGKSIIKQETFRKEELMMESNHGYFMTVKKSEDLSHSEPYELIIRSIVQFMPEKPQPTVETVEISKYTSSNDPFNKFNKRITKYDRTFKVDKKLWTSKIKIMNGAKESDNGWIENYVTRNDEADIEQTTSYYDSDKKLLKSEVKKEEPEDNEDYSDHLLYDVSGTLQISNLMPYKKSEDSFGYFGFEDYEESEGWNFKAQKVIKNGFALTGNNFLKLDKDETIQKSFIPKNKDEIFITAAWIRSNELKVGEFVENVKALISFSADGSNYTELFGILGNVKRQDGEWFNVEVLIDFLNTIRTSYAEYRVKYPQHPEFKEIKFKISLSITGTENSQIDVDNIAFYPAPHRLEVNVYNKNRDMTSTIRNDGQISRFYHNGMNFKEIGKTKNDGNLDQFLIRSDGEKYSPKTVTKFTVASGFHETFDKILFTNRWKMSTVQNWKVLPSELMHINDSSDGWIKLRDKSLMDNDEAAFRTEISLDSVKNSKFEVKFKTDSIKCKSGTSSTAELTINGSKIMDIPKHFEFAVYKYQKRTIIWIDGIVAYDQVLNDTWKDFSLELRGNVSIKNIFILNKPKVEIFYHNAFNEKEQEVKLESENSVIVTQYINDEFGREIVRTKSTRITQQPTASLLKFHKDFITSFDPKSGEIKGKVTTENPNDQGFPYYHTIFYKNPMNEKHKIGQPAKEFSLQSNFVTTYDKVIEFPFINAYFPDDSGFTKHVENLANGSKRIIVYDKIGNKVAKYVQVPNFDDALMTYEYDDEGRVVKVLSPEYHEAAKTVLKIDQVWMSGDAHLSDEEKKLQYKLGVHFKYDKRGNMIEKRTPDVGRQVFLYNSMNLIKFSITFNADPKDGQTIYYNYDSAGGLTETGHITRPVSVEYLKKLVDSNFHTQATEFQKIQFNNKNSKLIETINHDTTVLEEIEFDENEEGKIVSRKLTVPALTNSLQSTFNLQRKYNGDHVDVLTYPTTDEGKILKVKHTYNGIGQLIGIGTIDKPFQFAKFTYDANGQPTSEVHKLNNLNRNYGYTSTGYMNKIEDEFLSEDISYIDGGYGQLGYGDGIVMKNAFHAKWSDDFFNKIDGSNGQEGQEFNYDEGVLEEEEERSKREIFGEFVEDLGDEMLEDKLDEDDSLELNLKSIQGDKIKTDAKAQKILESASINDHKEDIPSIFDSDAVNSVRHVKISSKLEQILQKFKGFDNNCDLLKESETKNSYLNTKIDQSQLFKDQTLLDAQIYKPIAEESLNHKTNQDSSNKPQFDSFKIPLPTISHPESSKRHKRSSNTSQSSTQSQNSTKKSRQSKIDNVLSNFEDDSCISALKDSNFMSENSFRFKKLLNVKKEVNLPLKCHDENIYNEISARNQVPKYYGHRFTYGTHRELVKAKYFSTKEEEEAEPLQMNTFHDKIPGIEFYKSHNIFNILREGNFIAVDQRRDEKVSSIGTRGIVSLLRDDDLIKLLQDLGKNDDYDYIELLVILKQLILHTIETKKVLKLQDFQKYFLTWKSAGSGTFKSQLDIFKLQAKKLYDGLVQQQLLPTSTSNFITPINKKLVDDLKNYTKPQIIEIVAVLSKSFNNQLLTTAFDTASYEIDANGNHKKFATGFDSVKLDYHENTSKLKNLEVKGEKFTVDHDGYGNMTSAPHKGVKKIIYHPVSRRVMEVLLNNGGSIKFHYNAQGERILKQVYDPKYDMTKEILYIRDEKGNVLMDRVMSFNQVDKTCFEVVTHYIYGPRGMIGFIRDDKFHSIFTDYSGSVRLVIRDGEVVASYDYLPYGEMMRKFVADETADIRYLYNGKELDEETDMYNFHARFYDPTIGRFLQTDPQSQYFSPYKFSGNSPVSFIDPDGEFVFIIAAIICAVAGAYLGAAAHNNRWNPLEWDFKDPGTYLSFGLGAITGAFMPSGIIGAVGLVGVAGTVAGMASVAYLFAAAANESWNPVKWNFKDPETYNAIFTGAAAGAALFGNVKELGQFVGKLTLKGKVILFTFVGVATYAGGAAANDGNLKFWEWDFENPKTIKGMFDAFGDSTGFASNAVNTKNFIKNPISYEGKFEKLARKVLEKIKKIIKNPSHPLFKVLTGVAAGYLIVKMYKDDYNPLNWVNDAGTYTEKLKSAISSDNFAVKLTLITASIMNAKMSKDWSHFLNTEKRIIERFSKIKQNSIGLRVQGSVQLISNHFKENPSFYRQRIELLQERLRKEEENFKKTKEEENYISLDRSTDILMSCPEFIRNGFCHVTKPRWNGLRQKFRERNFEEIFEKIAVVVTAQRIVHGRYGYVTLMGPKRGSNVVSPDKPGSIIISNEPKPLSEQGMQLKVESKVEIDLQNNNDINSLILTDQTHDTAIYMKNTEHKLEIYHQQQDPETKIAIVIKNDGILFIETIEKEEIEELSGVMVARLFDANKNEIEKMHGVFSIPDDGVVQFIKNGEFKILKSINGTPIREVVKKNKINRQKNAEKLKRNLPNFTNNCDTCKSIHWDDHLPAGVADASYNVDANKEVKATAVIYKDDQNNWKLSSQLVQVDVNEPGKPEIADIRPSPKVFDLKVNKKVDDNSTRQRRNAPEFISKNPKILPKNFQFIDNSTQNVNHSSPSILTLGDFWLNATDFNSNMTLAYAFLKKWTSETLFSTNEENMPKISEVEFEIFANDLLHEFTENVIKSAIKCGMPSAVRHVFEEINFSKISREVKRKCEKNLTEEIPKFLLTEILDKNERKIVEKSSKKQFEKLRKIILENQSEFLERLTERNEKLYM